MNVRIVKRARDFLTARENRPLLVLFVAALAVRLAVWLFIFAKSGDAGFIFGDSTRYLAVAENFLRGRGYSSALQPPYLPDNYRTPGYPLFLIPFLAANAGASLVALAQTFLAALIPPTAFAFGRRLGLSNRAALFGAGFTALSPAIAIWSVAVLTEPLFTLLFLAGLLVFSRLLERPSLGAGLTFAALWGYAGLIRPVLNFPFAAAVVVLLIVQRRELRKVLASALAAAALFIVLLSPWLFWNRIEFGKFTMTSLTWSNIYVHYTSGTLALQEKIPFDAAEKIVTDRLYNQYGIDDDGRKLPKNEPLLKKLALAEIRRAPGRTLEIGAIAAAAFFTHDSTLDLFRSYGLLAPAASLSSTLAIIQSGPGAIVPIVEKFGPLVFLPLLFRAFWFLLFVGFIIFSVQAVFRPVSRRAARIFIAALIFAIAAMAASIGFGVEQRHRYPVEPLILMFGAAGLGALRRNREQGTENKEQGTKNDEREASVLPDPSSLIPDVSYVIPAFNEARRITKTLEALFPAADALGGSYEVILSDDGSTDNTVAVAEAAAAAAGRLLRVVRSETNRGKGAAVKSGMLAARGAIRSFLDADGSTDLGALPEAVRLIRAKTAEVVIGSRALAGSVIVRAQSFWRVAFGRLGNRAIRLLFLPGVNDSQCGFKVFSMAAAEAVFPRLRVAGWMFDVEALALARRLGFRIRELPVRWENESESKVRLGSYFKSLADLFAVRRSLKRIGGQK